MKINRIAHIAVYGREMDELKHVFHSLLGLDVSHEEVYEDEADLCFLPVGDTELELVTPTQRGNPFDRELDEEGTGLNHIALEVEDIASAVEELKSKQLLPADAEILPGGQGSKIIFLDSRKTAGVSIELVEVAS